MSTRIEDKGMDININRRVNSKYDPVVEAEVLGWLNQITGDNVQRGREKVAAALKNGQILLKLINTVYAGTPNLPPAAANKKHPFKMNTGTASFKMMENIQVFLNGIEAYGVPRTSLFQTVDLFEMRNMTMVLNSLYQLGTECQRHGFNGPSCGPKPTFENKRQFTAEQISASKTVIGLQAGSNKGASQTGMSMGAGRHIADIKLVDMVQDSQGIIGLQAGSNKGANQSGMSMGANRMVADMKIEDLSISGIGIIGLQSGSNKGASQSGMSMGSTRHIADIKVDNMSKASEGVIGLQAGSNQGASQSGMSMGSVRHVADIKVDDISKAGQGVIGLQSGSNKGANQSGMNFSAQRHIGDLKVGELN